MKIPKKKILKTKAPTELSPMTQTRSKTETPKTKASTQPVYIDNQDPDNRHLTLPILPVTRDNVDYIDVLDPEDQPLTLPIPPVRRVHDRHDIATKMTTSIRTKKRIIDTDPKSKHSKAQLALISNKDTTRNPKGITLASNTPKARAPDTKPRTTQTFKEAKDLMKKTPKRKVPKKFSPTKQPVTETPVPDSETTDTKPTNLTTKITSKTKTKTKPRKTKTFKDTKHPRRKSHAPGSPRNGENSTGRLHAEATGNTIGKNMTGHGALNPTRKDDIDTKSNGKPSNDGGNSLKGPSERNDCDSYIRLQADTLLDTDKPVAHLLRDITGTPTPFVADIPTPDPTPTVSYESTPSDCAQSKKMSKNPEAPMSLISNIDTTPNRAKHNHSPRADNAGTRSNLFIDIRPTLGNVTTCSSGLPNNGEGAPKLRHSPGTGIPLAFVSTATKPSNDISSDRNVPVQGKEPLPIHYVFAHDLEYTNGTTYELARTEKIQNDGTHYKDNPRLLQRGERLPTAAATRTTKPFSPTKQTATASPVPHSETTATKATHLQTNALETRKPDERNPNLPGPTHRRETGNGTARTLDIATENADTLVSSVNKNARHHETSSIHHIRPPPTTSLKFSDTQKYGERAKENNDNTLNGVNSVMPKISTDKLSRLVIGIDTLPRPRELPRNGGNPAGEPIVEAINTKAEHCKTDIATESNHASATGRPPGSVERGGLYRNDIIAYDIAYGDSDKTSNTQEYRENAAKSHKGIVGTIDVDIVYGESEAKYHNGIVQTIDDDRISDVHKTLERCITNKGSLPPTGRPPGQAQHGENTTGSANTNGTSNMFGITTAGTEILIEHSPFHTDKYAAKTRENHVNQQFMLTNNEIDALPPTGRPPGSTQHGENPTENPSERPSELSQNGEEAIIADQRSKSTNNGIEELPSSGRPPGSNIKTDCLTNIVKLNKHDASEVSDIVIITCTHGEHVGIGTGHAKPCTNQKYTKDGDYIFNIEDTERETEANAPRSFPHMGSMKKGPLVKGHTVDTQDPDDRHLILPILPVTEITKSTSTSRTGEDRRLTLHILPVMRAQDILLKAFFRKQ